MRPLLATCCCLIALTGSEPARVVELQAPLSTVVELHRQPDPPRVLAVRIDIPADAPSDLGIGAFRADRDGHWFQSLHPVPLAPGVHDLRFELGTDAALVSEPHRHAWQPSLVGRGHRCGVFLWSATASRCRVRIRPLDPGYEKTRPVTPPVLRDLEMADSSIDGSCRLRTGERWFLRCRPDPWPELPFHEDSFHLELELRDERGDVQTLAGFHRQPMALRDRGDAETADPVGAAGFEIRWRPSQPGRYHARLRARWGADGGIVEQVLPDLVVTGPLWDGYVRVDPVDHRFFSIGQRSGQAQLIWPTGVNLRAVRDSRCLERTGTRLTPERGSQAYADYFQRLGAAGCGVAEVWLSSWNLILEWREDWPGHGGIGYFHPGNAERIDRLLDLAQAHGMRLLLVVRNHGQASVRTDREWQHNPWNALLQEPGDATPGPLRSAAEFFTDPLALAGQDRLHRYLVARYADHPALFGWKLWSEQNLTAAQAEERLEWHRVAAARFKDLDPYDHPVTSHWSGDFKTPDRAIVALPELDFVCIDAYHGQNEYALVTDLLWDSTLHMNYGLGRYGKPVLVTEYGGNWDACPLPQLLAEHATGPWACLMAGHGGGPQLWWSEWVDQNGLWDPYGAVGRFLAGEDIRSAAGEDPVRSTALDAGSLRCLALYRRGWLLGWALDPEWGLAGGEGQERTGVAIRIGSAIPASAMDLEWWDAERGVRIGGQRIEHPGGELVLSAPAFRRQLAFKLRRSGAPPEL